MAYEEVLQSRKLRLIHMKGRNEERGRQQVTTVRLSSEEA